ncbi:MAG: hypothetical protein AABY65_13085 [Nitrospirota bacterium]
MSKNEQQEYARPLAETRRPWGDTAARHGRPNAATRLQFLLGNLSSES